ncbi:MAG: hypothetical protein GXO75_10370 [Calditrichaeota bacterium]|nr:hypothetical protein [Calditrichota bacterium]
MYRIICGKFCWIIFSFMFIPVVIFSQSGTAALERLVETKGMELNSLQRNISINMARADSLARVIAKIREKEPLNFVERRKLDRLLKTSQQLAAKQEKALQQQSKLSRKLREIKMQLQSLYAARLDSLVKLVESHPAGDRRYKKEWSDEIRVLQQKSDLLRPSSQIVSTGVNDATPQINEKDTPREIENKASFFRDRQDKYRDKAQQIEKKIKQVKEEARLRQRMAEMVDDVRLFDSRDETIRPSETVAGISATARREFDESAKTWNNADYMSGIGNTLALKHADQLLNLDFRSMPVYDIQDFIGSLDRERQKLLQTADSLSAVADTYEQKAEQLRKSIQAPPE